MSCSWDARCGSYMLPILRIPTPLWVSKWVKEQQDNVDKAKAMLKRVRERQCNKKDKHRLPASYQEGAEVLVHHSRLPAWPWSASNDPYFGPYKILSVDGHCITVR